MHRLGYYLHRLLRLDGANMWRLAGLIAAESRMSRLHVVADMVQCSVRYYAGYHDYHEWDWHLLRGAERRTYLTRPQAHELTLLLNDPRSAPDFVDKARFNRRFAAFIGREWLDLRAAGPDDLARFLARHGEAVVKTADGMGGAGIRIVTAAEASDPAHAHAALRAEGLVLVEERLRQHEDLQRVAPESVNTIRLITYLDGDRVTVLAHVLKLGNGEPVDNFGRAGMQTTLDPDGHAPWGAFDKAGNRYLVHPTSGEPIPGTVVPCWDEVLDLVDRAARVVPSVPYVGWDVAVTPDGPVLIEGNYDSGVFQMKPSMSDVRTGLREEYLRAIGIEAHGRRLPRSAKRNATVTPRARARA
jgi:hypothetical protein